MVVFLIFRFCYFFIGFILKYASILYKEEFDYPGYPARTESLVMPEAVPASRRVQNLNVYGLITKFPKYQDTVINVDFDNTLY